MRTKTHLRERVKKSETTQFKEEEFANAGPEMAPPAQQMAANPLPPADNPSDGGASTPPPPAQFSAEGGGDMGGGADAGDGNSSFLSQLKEDETAQRKKGGSGKTSQKKASKGSSGEIPTDILQMASDASGGKDYSDVKLETNSSEAKDAGAVAMFQNNTVKMAPGKYNPETKKTKETVLHELRHRDHQAKGGVKANKMVGNTPVNDNKAFEDDADSFAKIALNKGKAKEVTGGGGSSSSNTAQAKKEKSNVTVQEMSPLELNKNENKDYFSRLAGNEPGALNPESHVGPQMTGGSASLAPDIDPLKKVNKLRGGAANAIGKAKGALGKGQGLLNKASSLSGGAGPINKGNNLLDQGMGLANKAEGLSNDLGGKMDNVQNRLQSFNGNPEIADLQQNLPGLRPDLKSIGNPELADAQDNNTLARTGGNPELADVQDNQILGPELGGQNLESAESNPITQELPGEESETPQGEVSQNDAQNEEGEAEGQGKPGAEGEGKEGEEGSEEGGDKGEAKTEGEGEGGENGEGGGESKEGAGGNEGAESGGANAAAGGGGGQTGGKGGPSQLDGNGGGNGNTRTAPEINPAMGDFGGGKSMPLYVATAEKAGNLPPESVLADIGNGLKLIQSVNLAGAVANAESNNSSSAESQGAGNQPSSGPVAQLKPDGPGDGKKKKKKKDKKTPEIIPVDKDVSDQIYEQRRQQARGHVQNFQNSATSAIDPLCSMGADISSQINAAAQAAKEQVQASLMANKAQIKTQFRAARSAASQQALQTQNNIGKAYANLTRDLKRATQTARQQLDAGYNASLDSVSTMEAAMNNTVSTQFSTASSDARAAGTDYASQAKQLAQAKSQAFASEAIPKQSGFQSFVNGSDYHEKKRQAKVDAAIQVGDKYAQTFTEKANETAQQVVAGQGSAMSGVQQKAAESRQAINQHRQAALQQLQSAEQSAMQMARQMFLQQRQSIQQQLQANNQQLGSSETSMLSQADQVAEQQKAQISSTATQAVGGIQQQLDMGIQGLEGAVNNLVSQASAVENPDPDALKTALDQALSGIQSGVSEIQSSIQQGISQTNQGISGSASAASEALNGVTQSGAEMIGQMASGFSQQLSQSEQGAQQAFQGMLTNHQQQATQAATSGVEQMNQVVTEVQAGFDNAKTQIATKMSEAVEGLRSSLGDELSKVNTDIDTEAKKAADKVQPRWKGWVKILIDIVIAIVVTVAILAVMAIPGIGLLAMIGLAFVIGAAGGLVKQLLHDAVDGQMSSWQTYAKEGILGGIGGIITLAGAGLGNKLGEMALGKVAAWGGGKLMQWGAKFATETVVGTAIDTVGSGITDTISRIADGKEVSLGTFFQAMKSNVGVNFLGNFGGGLIGEWVGPKVAKIFGRNAASEATENVVENVTEDVVENTTENVVENATENVVENTTENVVENTTENVVENSTENVVENTTENVVENTTENSVENTTRNLTEEGAEDVSDASTREVVENSSKETAETSAESSAKEAAESATETGAKKTGSQLAEDMGYPSAPDGYHWANYDGNPVMRRNPVQGGNPRPQMRYNPDTGEFLEVGTGRTFSSAGDVANYSQQIADMRGAVDNLDDALKSGNPDIMRPLQEALDNGWSPSSAEDILKQIEDYMGANGLKEVDQASLPEWLQNTFYNGQYKTVVTEDTFTVIRDFGGNSHLGGGFAGSTRSVDVPSTTANSALLDEWGGSLDFEARIEIPAGTQLSVGKVGPQVGEEIPQFLPGGGDQILLPRGWVDNPDVKIHVTKLVDGAPTGIEVELPAGIRQQVSEAIASGDKAGANQILEDFLSSSTPTPKLDVGGGSGGLDTGTAPKPGAGDPPSGGGMKGNDVYDTVTNKKRIGKSGSATDKAVTKAFDGSNAYLVDGVSLAKADGAGNFKLNANGTEVKVQFEYLSDTDFKTQTSGSVHGADQGAAMNVLKHTENGWEATIYIHGDYHIRDLNKLAGHELNEVATIVARENPNLGGYSGTQLNDAIAGHQQAKVFTDGGSATGPLSAHDIAAVKELETVMNEIGETRGLIDGGKMAPKAEMELMAAREGSLMKLMESMGIKGLDDPKYQTFLNNAPNLSPSAKRWMDNHLAMKGITDVHGANQPFDIHTIDHLLHATEKNTTASQFEKMGINGGHDEANLQSFVSSAGTVDDAGTSYAKYKLTDMGSVEINVGGKSYQVKKFQQEMYVPGTGYVTAQQHGSPVLKTTFNNQSAQLSYMSDAFNNHVLPGINTSTAASNVEFTYNSPDGIDIVGYYNVVPGKTPPVEINSIYVLASSF